MTKREGALPRGHAFPSKPRKKGIPKAKGRTGRNSSSMTRALTGDNKINTNPGKRENVAISQISSAGSYSHNLAQSRLQSCAECNLPQEPSVLMVGWQGGSLTTSCWRTLQVIKMSSGPSWQAHLYLRLNSSEIKAFHVAQMGLWFQMSENY